MREFGFEVSPGTTYHQLGVLAEEGIIQEEKQPWGKNTKTVYAMTEKGKELFQQFKKDWENPLEYASKNLKSRFGFGVSVILSDLSGAVIRTTQVEREKFDLCVLLGDSLRKGEPDATYVFTREEISQTSKVDANPYRIDRSTVFWILWRDPKE